MNTEQIIITSEEEAFAFLERCLDGSITDIGPQALSLDGWPNLTIRLTGDKFDQSLTPSVMKGFIELQAAINRSVALTQKGEPNAALLSQEIRNSLEIKVKVDRGSSVLQVDFTGLLTNLGSQVIAAMDPMTLAITIVTTAAIWGSTTVAKHYISEKSKEAQERSRSQSEADRFSSIVELSQEETARMEIISRLKDSNTFLENSARYADDARLDLLKALSKSDAGEYAGVTLDGELASDLVRNARRKSEEVRLDGRYRILRNDTTDPEAFKVRVRNLDTHQEFEARVQDETLTNSIKTALQAAEWDRSAISLKVNAKSLEDTITNAVVIGLAEE